MKQFVKIPFLVVGIPVALAVGSLVLGVPSRSQAAGPPAVAVTNAGSPESPEPLIVSTADSPAHTPVHGSFSLSTTNAYLVPADKRLVIEYASGECVVTSGVATVSDGYIQTAVGGSGWNFAFPTVRAISPTHISFAGAIHIYADPGTRVRANYLYSGTGSVDCFGSFAGYLTNP